MKTNRRLIMWLLMMIMVLSLVGCGEKKENNTEDNNDKQIESVKESKEEKTDEVEEPQELSAKDIIDKMIEAYEGNTITQTDMQMEMGIDIEVQGMAMSMDMSSEGEMKVSMNPYKAYTNSNIEINMLEQNQSVKSESYVVEEEGNLYTYMYSDETGWSKVDSGMDMENMEQALEYGFTWLQEKDAAEFSLDKEMYELNNRKAYKVNLVLTGSEMPQILGNMYSTNDIFAEVGMGEIDMSQINTPCAYYVDAENFQILKIEMDMEGLDKMLMDIYEEAYEGVEGAEEMEIKISMDKCHVVYDNVSYDLVEVPELPEEALAINEALNLEEFVSGDDSVYILEEAGNCVEITCPEGWLLNTNESNALVLTDDANTISVIYVLYSNVTSTDMLAHVEDSEIPSMKDLGVYVSHEKVDAVDNYETVLLQMSVGIMTFAWTPVGEDGLLYVVVTDTVNDNIEDSMAPVLETIKKQ